MANSADPDQLASSEANWSRSTLFERQDISGFSRTRVNRELNLNKKQIHFSVYFFLDYYLKKIWLDISWESFLIQMGEDGFVFHFPFNII